MEDGNREGDTGADRRIVSLTGDKVALGPPHRGILPLVLRWENDLALSVLTGDSAWPVTAEAIAADYERTSAEGRRDWLRFVIYERATLRPIGLTDLHDINLAGRTAAFGITIGERDCWGKGYGTETTYLMLDYAFNALGLHNVMLEVSAYNERAIRAYQRAGFQLIGRRRQAQRVGARVYDEVLMDCLATDFRSPLPPVLDAP